MGATHALNSKPALRTLVAGLYSYGFSIPTVGSAKPDSNTAVCGACQSGEANCGGEFVVLRATQHAYSFSNGHASQGVPRAVNVRGCTASEQSFFAIPTCRWILRTINLHFRNSGSIKEASCAGIWHIQHQLFSFKCQPNRRTGYFSPTSTGGDAWSAPSSNSQLSFPSTCPCGCCDGPS